MPKGYRKCTVCGTFAPIETAKVVGGKAFCPQCAAARLKEVDENKKLHDFLYNLCDKDQDVMPFLTKQVRKLIDECGFKTAGILATLEYIFEISDAPPVFMPEYGIEGLVIRNYHKAKKFYEQVRELHKFPESKIDEILNMPEREIHLSKSLMDYKNDAYRNKMRDLEYGPAIDLDSIEDEEDIDAEV